eukprot:scaffold1653_cov389-Prasinococcus_capsulatus_cf.AAC.18
MGSSTSSLHEDNRCIRWDNYAAYIFMWSSTCCLRSSSIAPESTASSPRGATRASGQSSRAPFTYRCRNALQIPDFIERQNTVFVVLVARVGVKVTRLENLIVYAATAGNQPAASARGRHANKVPSPDARGTNRIRPRESGPLAWQQRRSQPHWPSGGQPARGAERHGALGTWPVFQTARPQNCGPPARDAVPTQGAGLSAASGAGPAGGVCRCGDDPAPVLSRGPAPTAPQVPTPARAGPRPPRARLVRPGGRRQPRRGLLLVLLPPRGRRQHHHPHHPSVRPSGAERAPPTPPV